MIRIAAYRGKSAISWCIKIVTLGKYSHVAVMLSDTRIIEAWPSANKVRVIQSLSDGHKKGTPVDIFELPTNSKQENIIKNLSVGYVGYMYDWWGILGYLMPWVNHDRDKVFCSELVGVLAKGALINKFLFVTPSKLSPTDVVKGLNLIRTVVTK